MSKIEKLEDWLNVNHWTKTKQLTSLQGWQHGPLEIEYDDRYVALTVDKLTVEANWDDVSFNIRGAVYIGEHAILEGIDRRGL